MGNARRFKTHSLHHAVLAAWAMLGAVAPAMADQPVDLGAVGTTGTAAVSQKNDRDSAVYQAPGSMSINATEPVFDINQHYVEENTYAGSNYTDIISILPSVVSVDPNGPGMMETQSLTIRGFQDGQYSVTFDGIPWGDSNDFTHHSTSYFMAQDIGNVAVDMGPGDASNIGYATFGGTVAVHSKDPTNTPATSIFGSTGSWNTHLLGAQFDTGNLQNYGDGKGFISYKSFSTDGYLTNSTQRRENLFMKFQKVVADDSLLTFVAMGNRLFQNVPYGATLGQMAQYGQNYGLSSNPASQAFYGYNYDQITSDFEYLGLKTHFGDVQLDNKVYTYAYYHNGYNGLNPTFDTYLGTGNPAGLPQTGTVVGGVAYPNDVPGQAMTMNYRSVGDIARFSQKLGQGTFDYGAWFDYQTNNRSQIETDWTQNQAFNTANQVNGSTGMLAYTDRLMQDTLTTFQPYAQYEWKLQDNWVVTPGLKYSYFRRGFDSAVQQGSGVPYNGSQSWEKLLPALTTNYKISPVWSVYAEAAEGFMAPNMNLFFKGNPQTGALKPQSTTNYQVGTVWTTKDLNVSADIYRIDFTNKITSYACGIFTCFNNIGGVRYEGGEAQATWMFVKGWGLYGNLGINNYSTSDGSILPYTPHTTAALGTIYENARWYASLIAKEVGERNSGTGNGTIPFGSYTVTDLNVSYKVDTGWSWAKQAKLGLQVNNLFNRNDIYATFGATDQNGNPAFFTLPERYVQANFALVF